MISFPLCVLKQLQNGIYPPVNSRRLLEHVGSSEDDHKHQQSGDGEQQRELLPNEHHENWDTHSEDKQKPQAKEILRVEAAGIPQPLLMSLSASEYSLNIRSWVLVLSHRLVIERQGERRRVALL